MSLESTEFLCLILLKIDTKFEGKLTCSSKNDMRKILENFHQSTFESLKIGTLMASFCLNLKMYELKIYWGVLCHDNEKWCKIWRGIHFSVQIDMKNLTNFDRKHSRISKICTLMACFWPKYIMFELEKSIEEPFVVTEDWWKIWRKTDLCFLKWHKEFGKFSFTDWKIPIPF